MIAYDLPEQRRRDRRALWRALRERRIGLIQRSVWVWPHDLEPALREITDASGIPECFCGFDASRLFLSTDAEVVRAAWDFETIARQHRDYIGNATVAPSAARHAPNLVALVRTARAERRAYADAISDDPLLPRELCPKNYRGFVVHERHLAFAEALSHRGRELACADGLVP